MFLSDSLWLGPRGDQQGLGAWTGKKPRPARERKRPGSWCRVGWAYDLLPAACRKTLLFPPWAHCPLDSPPCQGEQVASALLLPGGSERRDITRPRSERHGKVGGKKTCFHRSKIRFLHQPPHFSYKKSGSEGTQGLSLSHCSSCTTQGGGGHCDLSEHHRRVGLGHLQTGLWIAHRARGKFSVD